MPATKPEPGRLPEKTILDLQSLAGRQRRLAHLHRPGRDGPDDGPVEWHRLDDAEGQQPGQPDSHRSRRQGHPANRRSDNPQQRESVGGELQSQPATRRDGTERERRQQHHADQARLEDTSKPIRCRGVGFGR